MTPSAIVFDLDGTLVDATADIAAALTEAVRPLGARPLRPAEVRPMLGAGPRLLVDRCLAHLGFEASPEVAVEVLERYSVAYRATPAERTRLLDTAASVLPQLVDRRIRLGVCTNKRTAIAVEVLDRLGVGEYFAVVVGSDATEHPKPDPGHVLDTLRALGTEPEATWYVGDTTIDATAARAARVRYLHVAWGHSGVAADAVIGTFDELVGDDCLRRHGDVRRPGER